MQSYIIGLDPGYRGAPLESQIESIGASSVRVAGVRVADLPGPLEDYADQASAEILLRRRLTPGEVGCALAHRAACQKFLDDGEPMAMVFEDDARIMIPFEPDVLGRHLNVAEPRVIMLFTWQIGLVASGLASAPSDSIPLWHASTTPLGAAGYMLNRAAAEVLLEDGRRISSIADWPAGPASKIQFLFSYPWLVEPAPDAISTLNVDRVSGDQIDAGSARTKLMRHLRALLHITWLRHRRAYGDYRTYRYHEFTRLILPWVASVSPEHIVPGDRRSPLSHPTRRLAARLR
ncbi:glycosyltransferase family 25 protein [Cryobacterium sp. SO2]|uniref:glycosyltransferase family 25 protein n=1 Tax=Cryobacterium sp. SO2 TaxID=1897060 RepID=UPI00223E4931|nr:glycosyltransferase family 25 protein [Cryobacterium sp. SO2]WEO77987.1 glycosyltransferase family 25 protein [Cryobacterium sp. SO2]